MTAQQHFLDNARHIAFYGLSQSGKGFGRDVYAGLRQYRPDLQLTVVHPDAAKIDGLPVVDAARKLEAPADCAVIVLKNSDAWDALEDAQRGGIRQAWLVMNAATRENKKHARALGMNVVEGCPLLFIPGLGFPHNFHRWLASLFGKL